MAGYVPNSFTILTYRAFEPTEISGLKAWYDASSIAQSDGTSVSAWLDKSGNEAHMYQSTSASQPVYKTNQLNSKPVVRFDGVDDFLNLTAPFDYLPTSTATSGTVNNIRLSKTGNYLVYTQGTTPYIIIYKRNGNVFNRISTPASVLTNPSGIAWSSDDNYLAIGFTTSPYLKIYKRSGDTFTALSDPATMPDGGVYGKIDFSSDNTYLAICHAGTRRLTIYKRSGDTFTKLSDPATLPTGTAINCTFSNNGDYLAVGHLTAPRITIYSRSGDTFTKLANPVDLPNADVYSSCFSASGTYLVIGGFTSPATLIIYKNISGTFTKIANPSTLPTGVAYGVDFTNDENYLAVTSGGSNRLIVYSRSGDTFTKLADPATLPVTQGNGLSFSSNGNYLVVAQTPSSYIQAYSFDGTTLTNLTKLNMLRNVSGGTVISVIKYPATLASQSGFYASNGTTTTGERLYLYQRLTKKYGIGGRRLDADAFQVIESTQDVTNNFVIHSGLIDYENKIAKNYINGLIDGQSTAFLTNGLTQDTNSQNVMIGNAGTGSSNYLNGDIAEILVFNRALTTQELQNIHYYLSIKYNITLAT